MKRVIAFAVLGLAAALPVYAGNGHMLHGFGPVNSSMGGAGVALATDPVGALMSNPALLVSMDGNHVLFASEFFDDGVEIEVTLDNPDRRGRTRGTTNAGGQLGVLPSFGWTSHEPGSQWGFGFGLVAIAGFRTDYPTDPDSILFDTSPFGFGRIYTDYRVTRIPLGFGYRVNDRLALGASLNVYLAELAIAPLPYLVHDSCQPPTQPGQRCADETPTTPLSEINRFYPQGDGLVNEFTFGFQLGFLYTASPTLSFGGSITTGQDYDPFTWNSTFSNPSDFPANPNADPSQVDLPGTFGTPRILDYDLDGPMNATVGLGWTPSPTNSFAFDITWIEYKGVSGFGSPGGIVDRNVQPFGWKDVWAYKIGYQRVINPTWTVRAGYNYANTPIKNEKVLSATGALATFEHHFCGGVSYAITSKVTAQASFYHVPRNHIVGVYPDLDNNRRGTLDSSNKLDAVLVGFSWNF